MKCRNNSLNSVCPTWRTVSSVKFLTFSEVASSRQYLIQLKKNKWPWKLKQGWRIVLESRMLQSTYVSVEFISLYLIYAGRHLIGMECIIIGVGHRARSLKMNMLYWRGHIRSFYLSLCLKKPRIKLTETSQEPFHCMTIIRRDRKD